MCGIRIAAAVLQWRLKTEPIIIPLPSSSGQAIKVPSPFSEASDSGSQEASSSWPSPHHILAVTQVGSSSSVSPLALNSCHHSHSQYLPSVLCSLHCLA